MDNSRLILSLLKLGNDYSLRRGGRFEAAGNLLQSVDPPFHSLSVAALGAEALRLERTLLEIEIAVRITAEDLLECMSWEEVYLLVQDRSGSTTVSDDVSEKSTVLRKPEAARAFSPGEHDLVRVLYATDRKRSLVSNSMPSFLGRRSDTELMTFGECEVSIPHRHKTGKIESPSILRLELHRRRDRHVCIIGNTIFEETSFFQLLHGRLAESIHAQALLFIHGYDVSFDDAAMRTAQICFDLGFLGVPLLFSWPSKGKLAAYFADETDVEWSVPHLVAFLSQIFVSSGIQVLHVIAHSMGNRALLRAVEHLTRSSEVPLQLDQVCLTAPDIDSDVFRQISPCVARTARRTTLYASSNDKALAASKSFRGYPRAGQAGENVVICPNIDTVDVSALDTDFLSHSTFSTSRSVLVDIHELIHSGTAPRERFGLDRVSASGGSYWKFRE